MCLQYLLSGQDKITQSKCVHEAPDARDVIVLMPKSTINFAIEKLGDLSGLVDLIRAAFAKILQNICRGFI